MIPAARRFDHLHGAVREAAIAQADAIEREAVALLAELERGVTRLTAANLDDLSLHAARALLGRRGGSVRTVAQRTEVKHSPGDAGGFGPRPLPLSSAKGERC